METALRVLFVTPEISPYAISGELAEFAGSLPRHLQDLGAEVSVILPRYRVPEIEALAVEPVFPELWVPLGEESVRASVWKAETEGRTVYLVDHPRYFGRDKIYGTPREEYPDNDERFIFFNRAVLEFIVQSGLETDVLHCHNWPAALIPVFLKTHYAGEDVLRGTAVVFTLHNALFQGEFPAESLALTGLDWNLFAARKLSVNGRFNFLKSGVAFSDALSTVSAAYRKELLSGKDAVLAGLLRPRSKRFFAVRNGIDLDAWNPATDPHIPVRYAPDDPSGKAECKSALAAEFGLEAGRNTPLLAFVAHLTPHKGLDLLLESAPSMVRLGFALVVAGLGDERSRQSVSRLSKAHPGRIGVKFDMGPALSHRIVSGADMMLIPSREEPCGLNQLTAFRYGTVPVARAVGGLKETVRPFRSGRAGGNGFLFRGYNRRALLDALKRARDCFRRPDCWAAVMQEGFRERPGWEEAARSYMELYRTALKLRRGA
ncbi:MAG: glycogen synthase [Candidatus Aminicenantes bacterium]|nr:glycogen synthase [Candidatus Aminicenantes bacterium]